MDVLGAVLIPLYLLLLASSLLLAAQAGPWFVLIRSSQGLFTRRRLREIIDSQLRLPRERFARRALELETLTRRLSLTNRELDRLNAMKSKFLSFVVHDMRTPLSTIQGFAGLLGKSAPREARYAGEIQKGVQTITRLVGDLTDLAMIESGKLRMSSAPFDLAALCRDVVRSLEPRAASRGLALSSSGTEGAALVQGDRFRIAQVLQNLLDNALKFTPSGGRVSLGLRREGARAVVSVADTGPGLHPSERKAVFEKFYQSERSGAAETRRQGWGLGLSIAQEIVEAHGGALAADSPGLGRGSTFTVKLRLAGG